MGTTAVLIIFSMLCIGICHYVAKKRGANPVFWTVMGAVLGPFAVPFVFMAKPKQPKQS